MNVRFGTVWIVLLQAILLSVMQSRILDYAGQRTKTEKFRQIIVKEMQCFPIPQAYVERIRYEDDYGAARENGSHEGTDLADAWNQAGEIPVISCTDGVITNAGWIYLGGYRVGITSESGTYYYYAHLDSIVPRIQCGDRVCAGELIGFMGSTGEGDEKTSDRFPVHLHFGIYVKETQQTESAVNPYFYLQQLRNAKE